MSSPDITKTEIDAVVSVLEGQTLSLGPRSEAFEEAIASFIGAPFASAVNSGTSALHLCVIAAGVSAAVAFLGGAVAGGLPDVVRSLSL